MKKYKVTGMSCAACSARVERAVSGLDGVSSCSVNLLTGSLAVEGNVEDDAVFAAVKGAGYGISAEGAKPPETEDKDERGETLGIVLRLIFSLVLLIPLMYISMGHTMWGFPLPAPLADNPLAIALLQMLIALSVMLINGRFFVNGFFGLVRRAPNMDTLVALGSFASFSYSTAIVFIMSAELVAGNTGEAYHLLHELYFESAAMILALITVGKLLESRAKRRTTDAIKGLMDLTPKTATVVRDGEEKVIPVGEMLCGDVFIVRPGENIAVDGVVIEGESAVVEAALTGESIPAEKTVGSKVYGATSNGSGFLRCRATEVGEDTVIASVIRLVGDAAASKAPIAKIADKVSGVFVPAVMLIAMAATVVWSFFGAGFGFALARGISVLVISCPCALGLATPVAIMVAGGVGARRGILFKTAEALELCGRARIVALDKTGTVTEGKPEVTDIIAAEDSSEEELLTVGASLEYASEHPLAEAIVRRAEGKKLYTVSGFEAISGLGIKGAIDGEETVGGSYKLINQSYSVPEQMQARIGALAEEGKTPMLFAKGGRLLGIIAVRDRIKEDSREAVSLLRKMGIKVVMITGDNERTALAVASEAGIDEVVAGALPADKERTLAALSEGGRVVMVGDGINDAPALMRADVGMAIGGGADVAIDSADVVLVRRTLSDVAAAISLSRATLTNIKQNLFWAFFYNMLGIPLAAGVFIPLFNWQLNPMFGAAAMSISSFCVVVNALRLNLFRFNKEKILKKENKKMKKTIKIEGMMCPHCEGRVKSVLEALDGVEAAAVSHKTGEASLTLSKEISSELLEKTVTAQGYKVISVE